jgi:ADP-ribosyl-[dinitrogen reductase] hydrolase
MSDYVLGGLYGLLVGDAVGVPYEFADPERLPQLDLIDMVPPAGFRRSHQGAPPGAWSDDGAHALCLLASLLSCGRLDLDDLGRRLLNWHDHGYLAVDNLVFDVGVQTAAALASIRNGTPAAKAGPSRERDNGNGSLMRVLPLALWHSGTNAELIEAAALQSLVTHGHLRAQICCAAYCLWARSTLARREDPWAHAMETLRAFCIDRPDWKLEFETHVRPDAAPGGAGSGYVVDCLHSARLAAAEPSFERAVQRAISLGDDTDTTAAVAGGIVGLRDGLHSITERWLRSLPGREIVDPLAQRLLAHLASTGRAS